MTEPLTLTPEQRKIGLQLLLEKPPIDVDTDDEDELARLLEWTWLKGPSGHGAWRRVALLVRYREHIAAEKVKA